MASLQRRLKMGPFIRRSKQWCITWLVIWVIMYLLVIIVYPASPSLWFGWMPDSVITTFGLMVVTFILGYIFSLQRFKK
jgi:hypothetical protein